MALAANHQELPAERDGWKPDPNPRFGPLLAEAWRAENEAEFERARRHDTRLRVSKVGQCARATGYELLGVPRSEPPTLADHWRMGLGRTMHDIIEPVLARAFPGASIEFPVDCRLDEQHPVDMSGSGDVSLTYIVAGVEKRVVIEVKSINGTGFKRLVGFKGPGHRGVYEGPKTAHQVQGAIQAHMEKADELVILYLSLEILTAGSARKLGLDDVGRFIAEYTILPDQFEPLAQSELRRQQNLLAMIDEGRTVLPRAIPELGLGRVVDPMHNDWGGRWEERREVDGVEKVIASGEIWTCAYCDWRTQCDKDGPT